jgi:thioredoxin reductase (NADPH)
MDKRYDIAIIGTGPAGLEAAVNAKIRNKDIIMFGREELSLKLTKAPKINNYLGFHDISGFEIKEKFQEHLRAMDIIIQYEKITAVYSMGDYFAIVANDKTFEAKTVILATGIEFGKPLDGEEEFLGRGVGYCATCDAPLYKGKAVAVIGYNNEAEEDANFTAELVKKLYYIPMYKSQLKLSSDIEVLHDIPVKIVGDNFVNKLILKDNELKVDGIFVMRDSISPSQLVPGLEMEDGHIKTDKKMNTNILGCFAAGDCTGKPYQIIKAAGEGQVAALNAVAYLDSLK